MPARIEAAGSPLHAGVTLPVFYEGRVYRPAWVDEEGLLPAADSLLAAAADADREGLRPDDYHLETMRGLAERVRAAGRPGPPPALLAELDLLLTDAFGYMDDLDGDGRITIADAEVLFEIADAIDREDGGNPLTGGLWKYPKTSTHPPFVHVDTRGFLAR